MMLPYNMRVSQVTKRSHPDMNTANNVMFALISVRTVSDKQNQNQNKTKPLPLPHAHILETFRKVNYRNTFSFRGYEAVGNVVYHTRPDGMSALQRHPSAMEGRGEPRGGS